MADENNLSLEIFKPHQVIVSYTDSKSYYLELHDYFNAGGKVVMGSGKPLTKSSLKKMLAQVTSHDKSIQATVKNMLPTNVLYIDQRIGKHVLIWYQPPSQQLINFKSAGIKSGTSKVPAMLYAVHDDELTVFALQSNRRPNWKTKLFHSPFFNVYADGKVCMGNVKKPEGIVDIVNAMAAWEKSFWGSEFTHTVWGDAYKNLESFWKKRMKSKRRTPFPAKMLVASKKPKTFKELCDKI